MKIVPLPDLPTADLIVDCIYEGGRNGHSGDDPLHRLLPVSVNGGFRYVGSREKPRLIVIMSSGESVDWPDDLDRETGILTYYGDNRKPGHELHETPRFGNILLRDLFARTHSGLEGRREVPPVLAFIKTTGWRDVRFLGLAAPGTETLDTNNDLVAVWKQRGRQRFQNYMAKFTILDEPTISREWLSEVIAGRPLSQSTPLSWRTWIERGVYLPLKAPRVIEHRTRDEQMPDSSLGKAMLSEIHAYFAEEPVRFETCAVRLAQMMLPSVTEVDVTRPTRDGGRDATGFYRVGKGPSSVLVDFALEAKCYGDNNAVSVRELSRLISRLRHRQFGVLVTTSYVATQAYQELKEDGHPIVVISGRDVIELLVAQGIGTIPDLKAWLKAF